MRIDAVLAEFCDLDAGELTLWIERGWITPEVEATEPPPRHWRFEEIDQARVRLIYDLRRSCAVEAELIPLVLSLLDQVYDLRLSLRAVSQAIEQQPEEIKTRILQALRPLVTRD